VPYHVHVDVSFSSTTTGLNELLLERFLYRDHSVQFPKGFKKHPPPRATQKYRTYQRYIFISRPFTAIPTPETTFPTLLRGEPYKRYQGLSQPRKTESLETCIVVPEPFLNGLWNRCARGCRVHVDLAKNSHLFLFS